MLALFPSSHGDLDWNHISGAWAGLSPKTGLLWGSASWEDGRQCDPTLFLECLLPSAAALNL